MQPFALKKLNKDCLVFICFFTTFTLCCRKKDPIDSNLAERVAIRRAPRGGVE